MAAAHRHSASTEPGEQVCRSIRAAHSRYRALSAIDGARAPKTAPEPHLRAVLLAHSSTRPGSASKSNSPSRVSFANPPARTSAWTRSG